MMALRPEGGAAGATAGAGARGGAAAGALIGALAKRRQPNARQVADRAVAQGTHSRMADGQITSPEQRVAANVMHAGLEGNKPQFAVRQGTLKPGAVGTGIRATPNDRAAAGGAALSSFLSTGKTMRQKNGAAQPAKPAKAKPGYTG